MSGQELTLMAVHAHPDDEALSTGGILARYRDEGVRTVLVTCTDGACGDGPGGVKPGEPGHDPVQVVAVRAAELEASCAILAVSHLELLGYPDSGMMGWPSNEAPGSFWTTPVDMAAARLGELMRQYRPQVVVTYDPNGFYGHPDHIQAHRITMAAAAETAIPAKLYWPALPLTGMAALGRRLLEQGVEFPDFGEGSPPMGSPDEDITAWVDVAAYVDRKYDALAAHASQAAESIFARLGRSLFAELMGTETFIRAGDSTGGTVPETDLFAGLRPDGP